MSSCLCLFITVKPICSGRRNILILIFCEHSKTFSLFQFFVSLVLHKADMDSSSMISTNDTRKFLLHSVSASDHSSCQESSWSFYLEDFSDYFCGLTDKEGLLRSGCNKAVFVVDQELEDTASSPAPQHSDDELSQLYRNTEHMMDSRHMCQEYNFLNLPNQEEQEGIYYDNVIPQGKSNSSTTDEMELGEKEIKWTELGRKGLCLVPLSMLLNVSPNFILSI